MIERSSHLSEIGAAVTLYPNAVRILDSWGLDRSKARFTPCRGLGVFSSETLEVLRPKVFFSDYEAQFGTPRLNAHRGDFHKALKDLAMSTEAPGSPVTIQLSSCVVGYDAEKGVVMLEDGSEQTADLIVAADGVHSQAPTHILGHSAPAKLSRSTVIRFLIPTEEILKDSFTAPLLEHGDGFWSYYPSGDRRRYIVRYPCRDDTLQNFGLYTIREPTGSEQQGFRSTCDRSALRQAMEGFHPALVALCEKTADILPLWICPEREPLPTCYRGKVVMIGDALHPMLPHRGQGAASSIEDAATLGVLLKDVDRTNPQAIEDRLRDFQTVRLNRTSVTQLYSHENFFGDPINNPKEECLKYLPDSQLCRKLIRLQDLSITDEGANSYMHNRRGKQDGRLVQQIRRRERDSEIHE